MTGALWLGLVALLRPGLLRLRRYPQNVDLYHALPIGRGMPQSHASSGASGP